MKEIMMLHDIYIFNEDVFMLDVTKLHNVIKEYSAFKKEDGNKQKRGQKSIKSLLIAARDG